SREPREDSEESGGNQGRTEEETREGKEAQEQGSCSGRKARERQGRAGRSGCGFRCRDKTGSSGGQSFGGSSDTCQSERQGKGCRCWQRAFGFKSRSSGGQSKSAKRKVRASLTGGAKKLQELHEMKSCEIFGRSTTTGILIREPCGNWV